MDSVQQVTIVAGPSPMKVIRAAPDMSSSGYNTKRHLSWPEGIGTCAHCLWFVSSNPGYALTGDS